MKCLSVFLFCLIGIHVWGQELHIDSELSKIAPFIQALRNFSNNIPQEKVYLHFDNTSYYQGDHIWFKCYVTSGRHQLGGSSKTLYVELLNPGGEIVDKRILKIENGHCHGNFILNQFTFYSGFYEVRAYTKYMLNFGDEVIFSRLLPVFDKPKTEGNFEEKEMLSYGRWGAVGSNGTFPMKREGPEKAKNVNLRFFPEGGYLVQGITSRVAFEATDEVGNPINVKGVILDGANREICQFACAHEGRGVFTYTPSDDKRKAVSVVEYAGKTYRFDLLDVLPQGIVMEVNNLTYSDSIGITLRKNGDTPAGLFGVAVVNGGRLQHYCAVFVEEDEIGFYLDKTQLTSGVSRIVLFDGKGEILCDRLIFTNHTESLDIKVKTDKRIYSPYELVNMEISVTDREANPVHATFSLSVRAGENEVESNRNILTDLLLMSEIKGYVRNPVWYFEDADDMRREALDVLLMVQGWRRYSWDRMAGIELFEIKYLPEQGIETHGNVVSFNLSGSKQRPRPNVDVSLLVTKKEEHEGTEGDMIETFVTDNQGRFSYILDVEGQWNMILAVHEKGKPKNYHIMLDRIVNLKPKKYRYADLQVSVAENNPAFDDDFEETEEEDWNAFFIAYQDSLTKSGIDEQVHLLDEITVTAKRTREQTIFSNRSTSAAYYDVSSEFDDLYDSGNPFIGDNIHELLMNMNQNFSVSKNPVSNIEFLLYKNRNVLVVVDYKTVDATSVLDFFAYNTLRVQSIKSIYINETPTVFCRYYSNPYVSCSALFDRSFACVVLIETHLEGEIPAESGQGVRKTRLEGYSRVSEFYNPDYSTLPPEPDYRRTLYWNPMVMPDENGHASIQFYNNSRNNHLVISAETVTAEGMIGVY